MCNNGINDFLQVPAFFLLVGIELNWLVLVILVAKIILMTHFINLCFDWVNKKAPLLKRLEQLEIELESSNMKVADMQSKMNLREIEEKN